MEVSVMNGTLKHGIVALTIDEIDQVSGGKSAVSLSGLIGKIISWISNGGSQPSTPNTPVTVNWDAIVEMQTACIEAGGDASFSMSAGGSSGTVIIASGSGDRMEFTVNCVQ